MPFSIYIKNSFLLITEKIILLGLTFLTTILMARIAGPEFFGEFSFIISFVALFVPLCSMGLNSITTKYFLLYPKHNHIHFKTALILRAVGAIFCVLIGSLSAYIILPANENLTHIITLLTLQCFTFLYLVEHYFLAKKKVAYTLKVRLTFCILISITKVIAITLHSSLFTLILIHGLEFVFIGLSYMVLYYNSKNQQHNQVKASFSTKKALSLFHKGKWLLLSSFAAILYLKIDQVMIASMHNSTEVAYYAAASKLSEFWYVFPILIANVFQTKLLLLKKKDQQQYKNLILTGLSYMVVTSLFIIFITIYLSSTIIDIIYGEEYSRSSSILSIHIVATIFIFQRAIFSKWLIIEGHYRFSLFSHATGAITNILLNMVLIPKYGGVGAAWATLFSYMTASFLSLIATKDTRRFMLLMTKAMAMWPRYLKPSSVIQLRK